MVLLVKVTVNTNTPVRRYLTSDEIDLCCPFHGFICQQKRHLLTDLQPGNVPLKNRQLGMKVGGVDNAEQWIRGRYKRADSRVDLCDIPCDRGTKLNG